MPTANLPEVSLPAFMLWGECSPNSTVSHARKGSCHRTAFEYREHNHSFFFFFGHAAQYVGSQLPDQGLNPHSLQQKHGVLTTGQPGSPREHNHPWLDLKKLLPSLICEGDNTDVWRCCKCDRLWHILLHDLQYILPIWGKTQTMRHTDKSAKPL